MKTAIQLSALALALFVAACGGSDTEAPASTAASAESAAPAAPSSQTVVTCDRSCLLGAVDQYVAALVAHDPAQAPIAAAARFTENTVVLELGDGLWNTASAAPSAYDLRAADPETVVIRQGLGGSGFGAYDLACVDPEWDALVPPEQRNTREELLDVADRYVETLDADLAGHVQFSPDCNRIENGVITANNPQATQGPGAQSCQENVDSGRWVYITDINPHRFLVADVERGIAMGMFMFHHDGSHDHAMVNGERVEYSGATRRPFTTVIPEMFKVRDGRIMRIVATMASIPCKSKSGWD